MIVLIVEGKKDKKLIDSLNLKIKTIITDGPRNIKKALSKTDKNDKIIILADPDNQGKWIINRILIARPDSFNATKEIELKECIYTEKRNNKRVTKIGIEGCSKEYLEPFLKNIIERMSTNSE